MKITPLASALGAQVHGLDLSRRLENEQVAEIHEAWLRHQVLLFRGQQLTPQELIEFSARFAPLATHDNYPGELRHPDHSELLVVKSRKVRGERVVFGQQWHSDLSYTTRPSLGSSLYCLKLPPVGGDTLFANMYLAWETLSPTLQQILEPLEAVHDLTNGGDYLKASRDRVEAALKRNPPVLQPVCRVHPETGRKALFVSEWMCPRFDGMSREESKGLLEYLFKHATRPEFSLRQKWRVGDLLMWDNRCTVHMALADYPADAERELLRTSMVGAPSGRLLDEPQLA